MSNAQQNVITHLTHSHKTLIQPQYRPDVDGLRAIAVLLVVLFHAFPHALPGGFVGVDVFFVISGFLISTIIFDSLKRGRFSFHEFYARRIKRIFPALALVLVTLYVAGWFILLADEFKRFGKHLLAGAGFVSNLVLWSEVGYFDTSVDTKPLLHLWSLGIEEQFYIAYPLLIVLASRFRQGIPLFLCLVGVSSFIANIIITPGDASGAFYSPFTRFWELLLGATLAYRTLESSGETVSKSLGFASLIGLSGIVIGALALSPSSLFPGWNALLPTLGTALCITAGPNSLINRYLVGNKALVAIGLISYPLYLWHWPLISMSYILGYRSVNARVLCVVASFVLAILTYKALERPIRFKLKHQSVVVGLCAIMGILAIMGFVTYRAAGFEWRAASSQFGQNVKELEGNSSNLPTYPCPAELRNESLGLAYCRTSSASPPKFALFGDSHADDKFFGFATTDSANSWLIVGSDSCAPVKGINVIADHSGCREKSETVLDYLAKTRSIETVVFSFYGGYPLDTAFAADHLQGIKGPPAIRIDSEDHPGKSKAELFLIGLDSAVSVIESAGKQVVMLLDVPELPFHPRDCLRNTTGCELVTTTVRERQATLRSIITTLESRHPKLLVYDPLSLFCHRDRCSYEINGTLVYRDSHHLSDSGSVYFARGFKAWLDRR